MAKFLDKPLKVLDSLYDFVGGLTGLSDFSLEGSIQPVHDLSREAELAHGKNWLVTARQQHTGAGVVSDTMDVYGGGAATPINGYEVGKDEWVWLMDCWATMIAGVTANFTYATIAVGGYAALDVGLHDGTPNAHPNKFIKFYDDFRGWEILVDNEAPVTLSKLPTLIFPRTGTIIFSSNETGGVGITVDFSAHIWVGKKGTYPPGLY